MLHHNLFAVSPLIRPAGRAVHTNADVNFYTTLTGTTPFLSGHKPINSNLWTITVPSPPVLLSTHASADGKQLPLPPSSPNPTPAAGLPYGDSYRGLGVSPPHVLPHHLLVFLFHLY
jgi:hypothetical protein